MRRLEVWCFFFFCLFINSSYGSVQITSAVLDGEPRKFGTLTTTEMSSESFEMFEMIGERTINDSITTVLSDSEISILEQGEFTLFGGIGNLSIIYSHDFQVRFEVTESVTADYFHDAFGASVGSLSTSKLIGDGRLVAQRTDGGTFEYYPEVGEPTFDAQPISFDLAPGSYEWTVRHEDILFDIGSFDRVEVLPAFLNAGLRFEGEEPVAEPIPEPSTMVIWVMLGGLAFTLRYKQKRQQATVLQSLSLSEEH